MKTCNCMLPYINPEACKHCMNRNEVSEFTIPDFEIKQLEPMKIEPLFQFGWICPKCSRVLSPNQSFCLWCNKEHKEDTTSNNDVKTQ
jgi:hypothetical protein